MISYDSRFISEMDQIRAMELINIIRETLCGMIVKLRVSGVKYESSSSVYPNVKGNGLEILRQHSECTVLRKYFDKYPDSNCFSGSLKSLDKISVMTKQLAQNQAIGGSTDILPTLEEYNGRSTDNKEKRSTDVFEESLLDEFNKTMTLDLETAAPDSPCINKHNIRKRMLSKWNDSSNSPTTSSPARVRSRYNFHLKPGSSSTPFKEKVTKTVDVTELIELSSWQLLSTDFTPKDKLFVNDEMETSPNENNDAREASRSSGIAPESPSTRRDHTNDQSKDMFTDGDTIYY